MRHWLHLAARLYPQPWRARYGNEFDALLEDSPPTFRQLANVLWAAAAMHANNGSAYLKTAAAVAAIGAIAAAGLSFRETPRYLSTAELRLVPHINLGQHVDQTALNNYLAYQLEVMKHSVSYTGVLAEMIDRLNLYPEERRHVRYGDLIERTRARDLRVAISNGELTIAFEYPDPAKSQIVVSELSQRAITQGSQMNDFRAEIWRTFWHQEIPFAGTVALVGPATLPGHAATPNRFAFAAWGLGAGLLLGLAIVSTLRRPRRTLELALLSTAGAAIGLTASLLIPPRYTSETLMHLTQPHDPRIISGEKSALPLATQLHELERQILSRATLEELIQRPALHLYPGEPLPEAVEHMRTRDIRIDPIGPPATATSFRVAYSYADREKARAVSRELVSLFMHQHWANALERGKSEVDTAYLPAEPGAPGRANLAGAGIGLGLLAGALRLRRRA